MGDLTFDVIVPLPHRVAIFLQLGIFLWYALVFIAFYVYHINCLALLSFAYSPHKYHSDGQESSPVTGDMATLSSADLDENNILLAAIRKIVSRNFIFTSSGLVTYWVCLAIFPHSAKLDFTAKTLPMILLFASFVVVFKKGKTPGQNRLHTSVKRILQGKINAATMRTNDILISDSLTSYSKVINDLVSFIWIMFMSADSPYNNKVELFVLSYPALIRIKQCWYEFRTTRQRQHLLNLLKYTLSLGPVVINLLIKITMKGLPDAESSQRLNALNWWWYIVSTASSTYSFIWDIKMDWGFEAFDGLFGSSVGSTTLLRGPNKLIYKSYILYGGAIVFDFFIRFIWIFKAFVIKETEIQLRLQNHVGNFLFGYDYLSLGYAMLELLEIVRRWVWCFLKLESDLVKLQLKDDFARAMPLANLKLN